MDAEWVPKCLDVIADPLNSLARHICLHSSQGKWGSDRLSSLFMTTILSLLDTKSVFFLSHPELNRAWSASCSSLTWHSAWGPAWDIAGICSRQEEGTIFRSNYASIQKQSVLSPHHIVSQPDPGKTELSLKTSWTFISQCKWKITLEESIRKQLIYCCGVKWMEINMSGNKMSQPPKYKTEKYCKYAQNSLVGSVIPVEWSQLQSSWEQALQKTLNRLALFPASNFWCHFWWNSGLNVDSSGSFHSDILCFPNKGPFSKLIVLQKFKWIF